MTPQGIPPPDALRERIRASMQAERAPRFGRPARIAVGIGTVTLAVLYGIVRSRPDLHGSGGSLVGLTIVLALLAIATFIIGFSGGRRGLGAPFSALVVAAIVTAPLYAFLTTMWPIAAEAMPPSKAGCFSTATALGAFVLAGLTVSLKNGVPAAPTARGALVGACAGAWAGLAIHLHCPAVERMHVILGHTAPIVIATIAGVLIVPRFLRP